MVSSGKVRVWHDTDGWGVIDSEATAGGCWAGFHSVRVPGHRRLDAGQQVRFTFEPADQDGYSFRAVEVWPEGQEPVRTAPETAGPGTAYQSTLTVTFEERSEP